MAHVPFSRDLLAAYYCALDDRTPARAKAMLFGAVAYFILPVDVIPDFILGMGFTDDAAVIASVLALFGRYVTDEHRVRATQRLDELRSGEG
ncbi:MAG: YkvA family protein [Geminicoccaceae bacterium]